MIVLHLSPQERGEGAYNLRRAHRSEETGDLEFQPFGLRRQSGCGAKQSGCRAAELAGSLGDADNVLIDLTGAVGGLLHVAGNLAGRRSLLFDRGGNRTGDFVDLGDGPADLISDEPG